MCTVRRTAFCAVCCTKSSLAASVRPRPQETARRPRLQFRLRKAVSASRSIRSLFERQPLKLASFRENSRCNAGRHQTVHRCEANTDKCVQSVQTPFCTRKDKTDIGEAGRDWRCEPNRTDAALCAKFGLALVIQKPRLNVIILEDEAPA